MNIAKEISFFFFILLTEAFASVGRVVSVLAKFLLAYFLGGLAVIGWADSLIHFGDAGVVLVLYGIMLIPTGFFFSLLTREERLGDLPVLPTMVLFLASAGTFLLWDHLGIISWFGGAFSKEEAVNLIFTPIFELLS